MVSLFQRIMSLAGPSSAYSVSANGQEGWVTTGNGTQNPAKVVLIPAVAIPAMLAGIAIPNFVRAREVARERQAAPPQKRRLGEPGKPKDDSQ